MKKGNLTVTVLLVLCLVATILGVIQLFSRSDSKAIQAVSGNASYFKALSNSKPGIGVVRIYGPIFTDTEGSFMGLAERGSDAVVRNIDRMRKDDLIKAVILRVNSPGGSLAASQEIADAVQRLRKSGKKVYVSMADIAASGGYYISAPAHKIIANRGTITGSIGVLTAGLNLAGLMEKHGVKMNVIKQGKNKDLFAYWRDMTPEEEKILQDMSQNAYEQFLEAVSKGRNIPRNELLAFADGRIFTGEQALQLKLVDELGGFDMAVRLAATEVGLDPENPNLVFAGETGLKRFFQLMSQESSLKKSLNFLELMTRMNLPVLYFCMTPLCSGESLLADEGVS